MEFVVHPIGVYKSSSVHPYEVGRQPRADDHRVGEIILNAGTNFEQALIGLAGFERIWVIFQFHHNSEWKPMVRPPRGDGSKQGVFATRAPYRPNPIGMSCLRLESIDGLTIRVLGADLLDGTPILDIKPYISEIDAFPNSKMGWLEKIEERAYKVSWAPLALEQIQFLEQNGVTQFKDFLQQQLQYEPFDDARKRVSRAADRAILAYRTWRAEFKELGEGEVEILRISSGYSATDLADHHDKWGDKPLHKKFIAQYPV